MTNVLPEEICPACMMRKGFVPSASEAAEELEATQTANPEAEIRDDQSFGLAPGQESQLVDGQTFGEYTIVRRLGRGGMGTVYEADHHPTGRRVALKVLAHSLDNPQARARFLREGRLAASINHPNSVYVYGTEQIGEIPTISMELIHGGTLQQLVKSKGKMEVTAAVDAVLQIIDGLEAADRKGVLHRDIKPANCFVDASGVIKIGDFGLSISTEARDDLTITNVTGEGTFLGTPAFASPEQLRGEPLDRRSDIYAVGVTLYYLLTGQTPFSGDNMVQLLATVLDKPAPSLKSLRPDVPEELDALVQRCLQKSPGQRFSGYDALREALLPLSSTRPTPAALGSRVIANIIDIVLLSLSMMAVMYGWQWLMYGRIIFIPRAGSGYGWYNVAFTFASLSVPLLYYLLCEWRAEKTLGKHLLRLRVISDEGGRISLWQATMRSAIFVIFANFPAVVYSVAVRELSFEELQQPPVSIFGMVVGLSYYLLTAIIFSTARSRNGFAGIHDLASHTRVVCKLIVPQRTPESTATESFDATVSNQRIGPYHVLQPLWGSESDGLVMAYDRKLLRRVWLRVQPPGFGDVDAVSRGLTRVTRLRWLGAQRTESECWDCYEAPDGKPLTTAIRDGLRWEAVISALRQLISELQTATDEGSLADNVSLEHLWLTEGGSLKILPFAMPVDRSAADQSSSRGDMASEDSELTKPLRLFRETADYAYRAVSTAGGIRLLQRASLSALDRLQQACQATSLQQAARQVAEIASQPTVDVRMRSLGLQVVSLAVPSVMILSTIVASVAIEAQKARMPQITELSKVAMMLEIESMVPSPEQDQRIAALETLIAADYREPIEDKETINSVYAAMVIPTDRAKLEELISRPPPSAEEAAVARQAYEQMLSETEFMTPAEMGFFSFSGFAFVATVAWMELIWIPSLFTAVFFGGGLLMWMFGLTLVNEQGQRASRWRVLMRMALGGIPAVAICAVFLNLGAFQGLEPILANAASIVVIIVIALLVTFGHDRPLHDRVAGTYLVAR